MLRFELTQHSVGQGGFFTGTLKNGDRAFRWAYDCGSNQIEALNREVDHVSKLGPINQLYLSHLDSDHISGIDRLLSACEVEEVILPYTSDLDRALLLCRDISASRITGSFSDFVHSPEAWLGRRGVSRVTYIRGTDDDSAPEGGVPLPPEPGEGGDGKIVARWSQPAHRVYHVGEAEISEFLNNASVHISVGGSYVNWLLAPYVHRPSKKRMELFRNKIKTLISGTIAIGKIGDLARSNFGRENLRNCYDVIWVDHNLISMALYSGPSVLNTRGDITLVRKNYRWGIGLEQAGWLGTGDFQIASHARRRAFTSYYEKLLSIVGVFVLPHHGSSHNFDIDILASLNSLRAAVAPAGPNSYGHPHPSVKRAVRSKGVEFYRVGDRASSSVRIEGTIR